MMPSELLELLACRTRSVASAWMPSSPLDLQNTLEVGDDALEIFTCRTRSVASAWMPSSPLDLQNNLELGVDALEHP